MAVRSLLLCVASPQEYPLKWCALFHSANPSPVLPPSDWCFIPCPSQVDLENTVSVDSSWEPVGKALASEWQPLPNLVLLSCYFSLVSLCKMTRSRGKGAGDMALGKGHRKEIITCPIKYSIFCNFFLLIHSIQTFNSLTIFHPQMRLKEILCKLILWGDSGG